MVLRIYVHQRKIFIHSREIKNADIGINFISEGQINIGEVWSIGEIEHLILFYKLITKTRELSDNFFNHHPHNLILHQPELNVFPISKNDEYYANDYHAFGENA